MKAKLLGFASLSLIVFTVLWLALLILGMANEESADSFEKVLANVSRLDAVFYLTYLNATLITLIAVALFAGLYCHCKPSAPKLSMAAILFIPVYATLNIFSYLSQILVVPNLVALHNTPEYEQCARLLLRQFIQQWPESAVFTLNNLGYAVLGIPSIVFGWILSKEGSSKRIAGIFLALSGVASILGIMGIAFKNSLLGQGSLVGGVLFLISLLALSRAFLRET